MNEETMPDDATAAAEEAEETTAALLTAAQVAQALGISTRRLRDWRKEGRIAEVGRFKRGTARIPLFAPADVARLQRAAAAEEAPAAMVAAVPDSSAFAEAVARQVRYLLAERSEAEAAAVAPLVALVREQQETIDELRHRAEAAEAERDALRAADLHYGAKSDPIGSAPPADPPMGGSRGLRARLGRWWRGKG